MVLITVAFVKSFEFAEVRLECRQVVYSRYDTYDNTYEDEVFTIADDSTKVYDFAKPLETGVVYNVYKNGTRIDDPNYGTANPTTVPNAVMQSITGAGQTGFVLRDDSGETLASTVIQLDEEQITLASGDVFVVRKNTSDGSFIPDPRAYDTVVTAVILHIQQQQVLIQKILI